MRLYPIEGWGFFRLQKIIQKKSRTPLDIYDRLSYTRTMMIETETNTQEGGKMKRSIKINMPRSTAILYLALEFGLSDAARVANELPTDHRGWLNMAETPLFRLEKEKAIKSRSITKMRRWAEGFKDRIENIVSYQQGRLGKPLSDASVSVVING